MNAVDHGHYLHHTAHPMSDYHRAQAYQSSARQMLGSHPNANRQMSPRYSAQPQFHTQMQMQTHYNLQHMGQNQSYSTHLQPRTQSPCQYGNHQPDQSRECSPQAQSSSQGQQGRFLCLWPDCSYKLTGFVRKADLQRHVSVIHNSASLQRFDCEVETCHRKGDAAFNRKDKMVEHMREVHKKHIEKAKRGKGNRSSESPDYR